MQNEPCGLGSWCFLDNHFPAFEILLGFKGARGAFEMNQGSPVVKSLGGLGFRA